MRLVDEYLDWLTTRQKAHSTILTYRSALNAYMRHLEGATIRLSASTYRDVEAFGYSQTVRGVPKAPSAATVKLRVTAVRSFHEWAVAHGHDAQTVGLAAAPRVSHRNPKPVLDELWLRVWDQPMADQDRLLLGLGYFGGLRRQEIVTLRPSACRPQGGLFTVIGKGDKERIVEYEVAIQLVCDELPHLAVRTDEWQKILWQTVEERSALAANYVWWDTRDAPASDAQRVRWHLRRILAQAGVDQGAFTPHQLRHSCATNLLRAGLEPHEIMDYMGHTDFNTSRRYLATSGTLRRAAARRNR